LLFSLTYAGTHGSLRFDILWAFATASAIAYGIHKRRAWIPFVVTLLAAWGIISNIFSPVSVIASIFSIVLLSLEIYFFNRKDVKTYLGVKGVTLFGL
jgi:hypothetical protein